MNEIVAIGNTGQCWRQDQVLAVLASFTLMLLECVRFSSPRVVIVASALLLVLQMGRVHSINSCSVLKGQGSCACHACH